MNDICKCCGQTLPPDNPFGVRLTGREWQLADRVRRAGNHGINGDALFEYIYNDDPDGGPDCGMNVIKSRIVKLNHKLRPHRLKIISLVPRGRGIRAQYAMVKLT